MFKKILSFAVCAVTAISFGACGEDGAGGSLPENTSAVTSVLSEAESLNDSLADSIEESAAESKPEPETAKGSSSLFIYLCGSDLETKQGIASKMLKELLTAEVPENMNIIIQTGGAAKWRGLDISADESQRYEVRNGELRLIESLGENKNMGASETLRDFAAWCDDNYRSERNMMMLWDHGAGSVRGVCFDEAHEYDPLTLVELSDALKNADLKDKYDIIGFDACLMATIETAISVKDHADYMIASQDIEPSCGWGLKTVAETFANEPDPKVSGKVICDDFINRCKDKDSNDYLSTLSLFDLSKTDMVVESFNNLIISGNESDAKDQNYSNIMSAIRRCEHFGSDSVENGYSNMLDMVDFLISLDALNDTAFDMMSVICNEFVVYYVDSEQRSNFGLSFYFPTIYDAEEIDQYLSLGINETYNNVLRELYTNIPKNTVVFEDDGSVSEDGAFTVKLTPESQKYLTSIDFVLMTTDENGNDIAICADNDIQKDWENLVFKSNFRGITMAFGGHRIFSKTICSTGNYITFSAPMKVNDEKRNFQFSFVWNKDEPNNGHYFPGGLWGGYDENGIPSTIISPIEKGSKIQLFSGVTMENGKLKMIPGDEYIYEGNDEITELPLDGKEYKYYFVATDRFGKQIASKQAILKMKKSYEELLENPLPDGTYAADVVDIRKYTMPEERLD